MDSEIDLEAEFVENVEAPPRSFLECMIEKKSEFYLDPEPIEGGYKPFITDDMRARIKRLREPTSEGEPAAKVAKTETEDKDNRNDLPLQLFINLVDPQKAKELNEYSKPAWATCVYKGDVISFHNEIVDWVRYINPTESEVQIRLMLIKELEGIVREIYPDASLRLFGSMMNGLCTSYSDIDITIYGAAPKPSKEEIANSPELVKGRHLAVLGELYRKLLQSNSFTNSLEFVNGAKVPIIKCKYKNTIIGLDISVNSIDSVQTINTIRKYQHKYPFSTPLTLVIKHFLQQRDLNNVFKGGLSSFATYLMVIAFLDHWVKTARSFEANLGMLLIEFFKFYGRLFNFASVGICFSPSKLEPVFFVKDRVDAFLTIYDADKRDNNLTARCTRIQSIVGAFELAYNLLIADTPQKTESCVCINLLNRPTRLSRIINTDIDLPNQRSIINGISGDGVQHDRSECPVTRDIVIASLPYTW